ETRCCPSGDHCGCWLKVVLYVRRNGVLRCKLTAQMLKPAATARRFPSGERRGCEYRFSMRDNGWVFPERSVQINVLAWFIGLPLRYMRLPFRAKSNFPAAQV